LVLVRKGLKADSFAELRGTRLVYGPSSEQDVSMIYLQGLLQGQGVAGKKGFFKSAKRLSCEDACFVSLQRGNADVTCITEERLDAKTLVAGNVFNYVRILNRSDPCAAYAFLYVRGQAEEDLVRKMRRELMRLHETTKGRSLLDMFRVRSFVELPEASFVPIERLLGDLGATLTVPVPEAGRRIASRPTSSPLAAACPPPRPSVQEDQRGPP
jgi:ABC-type phosphate/phosphonate transport system substrate-binding protein